MTPERDISNAIETYSGGRAWPLDLHESDVHIEDIAHSLAYQCRFLGHVDEFYSVAQHCIILTSFFPMELKATALLHDAAEAYLGDIAYPVKEQLSNWGEVEDAILEVVGSKYGVQLSPLPEKVKIADMRLLCAEADKLMTNGSDWWPYSREPFDVTIDPMAPEVAEEEFLRVFNLLAEDFYIDTR